MSKLDDIVFRCFAQGQYWGTELEGQLDPDYKPEQPIDRAEAVTEIKNFMIETIELYGGKGNDGLVEKVRQL